MAPKQLALVFDLDGTLVDIEERHYRVYAELVNELSGAPLERSTYWNLKRQGTGWPTLLTMSKILGRRAEDFLTRFIGRIEEPKYLTMDRLFPETLVVLDGLSDHHRSLITLRRSPKNLFAELQHFDLNKRFDEVLTGATDSEGFLVKAALVRQAVGQRKTVVIGDTEADIMMAKEVRAISVAVLSGIRDKEYLEHLSPDHIIGGIGELPDVMSILAER